MSIIAGPLLPSSPGKEGTGKSSSAAITEKEGARTRDAGRARLEREVGRQAHEMTLPRTDTASKGPARVMSTNWPNEYDQAQRDLRARTHGTYGPALTPQGSAMQMGQAAKASAPPLHQAGLEAVRARLAAAVDKGGGQDREAVLASPSGPLRLRTAALPKAAQMQERDREIEPEW